MTLKKSDISGNASIACNKVVSGTVIYTQTLKTNEGVSVFEQDHTMQILITVMLAQKLLFVNSVLIARCKRNYLK